MKKLKIVLLIFILTLIFRLFFVFQTPYFSDDNAYFNLRQIEGIREKGTPIFQDDLSYSGKEHLFSPLFHYFLTFFAIVFGSIALKIVPEILISSLVLIVFFITRELTKDDAAVLFSSFIAGFVPILFSTTLNNLNVYSLALPLTFLTLLAFIKIPRKGALVWFVLFSILLPVIHPVAFLISLSFIFYLLISKSEDLRIKSLEKESIFFFIFITLLAGFLIYRKAFLMEGFEVVRQNIPFGILENFFINLNLGSLLIGLGVIPLLFALAGVFFGVFKDRNAKMVLFSSVFLSSLVLLLLKLINFEIGVLFLSIAVTILASVGFEKFFKYIDLTKISKAKPVIVLVVLVIVLGTLIIPAYNNADQVVRGTLNEEEILVLEWIRDNLEEDAILLSSINEGNYITSIAERKNVMDNNFLLVSGINERFNDIQEFFTTTSISKAVNVMEKYGADYAYVSERTEKVYNREEFNYLEDKTCFRKSYGEDGPQIYKLRC